MTARLQQALKALEVVRTGNVIRNADGSLVTDSQARDAMYRICRLAGLLERGWHVMRHSFGTHAAMLGVNPWRLQSWMGHKRIDETMLYVHVAEAHRKEIPAAIFEAGAGEANPDRRVLAMLGRRCISVASPDEAAAVQEESRVVN